jgi:hypothetical protein
MSPFSRLTSFLIRRARKNSWVRFSLQLTTVLVVYLVLIQNSSIPPSPPTTASGALWRACGQTPPATPVVFYDGASKAAAFYARAYLPSFPAGAPEKAALLPLAWEDR